jgi:hypothetical protein
MGGRGRHQCYQAWACASSFTNLEKAAPFLHSVLYAIQSPAAVPRLPFAGLWNSSALFKHARGYPNSSSIVEHASLACGRAILYVFTAA